MKTLVAVVLSTFVLSGCLSNNMEMTKRMSSTPSVPQTQAQAEVLAPDNPERVSVYFFVPSLFRANAFSVAINGRAANVRLELDDKSLVRIPVEKGVRLELQPNQTYAFRMGEDWEERRDLFMKRQFTLITPDIGEFKAFDLSDDNSFTGDPTTVDVKRLTLEETLARIENLELIATEQPMPLIAALTESFQRERAACLKQEALKPCADLVAGLPEEAINAELQAHIDRIEARIAAEKAEEQRKQQLVAMEQALPANVRRDKYMLQLTDYLKQEKYQQALTIFPKLEALPVKQDPSLGFFYAEALLKVGQTEAAQQKLYAYVSEQGADATHYTRALELLNQVEHGVNPSRTQSPLKERAPQKSVQTKQIPPDVPESQSAKPARQSQPSRQTGSTTASSSGSGAEGSFFACYDPRNFICIEYSIKSPSKFQQMRQQCARGGNRIIDACDRNAPNCFMRSSVGSQTTYVHNMTEPSAVRQACLANEGTYGSGG